MSDRTALEPGRNEATELLKYASGTNAKASLSKFGLLWLRGVVASKFEEDTSRSSASWGCGSLR